MAEAVGNPRLIKLLNKDVIEGIIKMNGPVTKPEIAKISKLSLVTVNKIVDLLLEENKVKISEVNQTSVGRKAQHYVINESASCYIGLYYEDGCYTGAVSNSVGSIICEKTFPVRKDSYETMIEDTVLAVRELQDMGKESPVLAVGIGVPGVVQGGCVSNIPKIPGWEGIDVAERLETELGLNVYLENDINLVTMGVYCRDFQDEAENLVLIYLDQGVGSGIIVNGSLFKGFTNFAGELGNLPVTAEDGSHRRVNFEQQLMRLLEKLAAAPEEEQEAVKNRLIQTVADGLLSVVCVLNPEVIAIQCSSFSSGDLSELEKAMADYVGTENVPWLVKIEDFQKHGVQGAINMCIREYTPIYTLERRR